MKLEKSLKMKLEKMNNDFWIGGYNFLKSVLQRLMGGLLEGRIVC